MEDREQRRRARRESAISENITRRSQSYWEPAGEASGQVAAAAAPDMEGGESGPQAEGAQKPAEPAAAPAAPETAAPMRPARIKSSEETMVFVIKTNAIRERRGSAAAPAAPAASPPDK